MSHLKLYDGDKECQVAMMKISRGTKIAPPIGDTVYLIDSKDRLIDAASLPAGATITVKGVAGYKIATDANGGSPTGQKYVDARGAVSPSIEINSIALSNGDKAALQLACARPSTQQLPTTMR